MSALAGIQSTLNPQGSHAAIVAEMTWVLLAGGTAIFMIVMALAAYALFARRERASRMRDDWLIIGGGVGFPIVVLSALLAYSLVRAAAIDGSDQSTDLRIEVTGEQWWWRVRYLDASGAFDFATANEIRIPAGRAVMIELRSNDVLHSFWVPSLAGKLDVIPGRTNRLRISADRAGTFRGQCAEYCGGPHAWMAFHLVAEDPARFAAWAKDQRTPAAPPDEPQSVRGERLFTSHCAACHTVRGTSAAGDRGPDLTHIASRATLAAGRLPNNPGTLAAWIADSQRIKPGNLMPSFRELAGDDLHALASYLHGLR